MAVELTEEGTSRFVQTKSWKIHYNEAGEGHPVLLLHGSGPGATGWSNFYPNLGALSARFRTVAVDMPGWGRSDATVFGATDQSATVIEVMDSLGIEQAALIGNSMGGATSLAVAARHPERVSHLITMGSGSYLTAPTLFGPGDGPSEGLKVLFNAYRNPTPEQIKALVQIMTFSDEFATDELAALRSEAALARPDHLENFLEGLQNQGFGRYAAGIEEIASISTPSLLLHGRDDRVVQFEHSLRLLPLIRNSRMVLVNRCGHWLQIEHAAEFNRLAIDFIENN